MIRRDLFGMIWCWRSCSRWNNKNTGTTTGAPTHISISTLLIQQKNRYQLFLMENNWEEATLRRAIVICISASDGEKKREKLIRENFPFPPAVPNPVRLFNYFPVTLVSWKYGFYTLFWNEKYNFITPSLLRIKFPLADSKQIQGELRQGTWTTRGGEDREYSTFEDLQPSVVMPVIRREDGANPIIDKDNWWADWLPSEPRFNPSSTSDFRSPDLIFRTIQINKHVDLLINTPILIELIKLDYALIIHVDQCKI